MWTTPNAIDAETIEKPTPKSWSSEISTATVDVVPLVDGASGPIGWCTGAATIEGPDVEIVCGGINTKQPSHAAVWRHGNLMHFGFEPSPPEMNDSGRALLLNAIAYIARFTEDRPIAVVPSSLSERTWVIGRHYVESALDDERYDAAYLASLFASPWSETIAAMGDPDAKAFVRERIDDLRCEGRMLAIDEDASALGLSIGAPGFPGRARDALDTARERTIAILARTIPAGPGASADAATWRAWLDENGDYVFFSAGSGYVWLVDPLAKRRGFPTLELRGALRADEAR